MSGENRPAIGDFPAGAQIGGYQIRELIGRGGMAVVYRAADVRLDRQVALKVLAPELTKDAAFRQRFIRESRAGAAVDHPNVIPVFEAGEADGVLFIAMRYVAGRDVRALLEQAGPLPPARAVSIITQIASALDAAHARGLVHRDVKPANMLLGTVGSDTAPDHVYLSDFGLSKLSASAVSLTGTGQFLGTIDYMSPEQVEGRPTDGRTDLYALACAAFEMLTGRPPFHRDQDLAVMWAQVSAPPPSARKLRPELPAAVDQALAKALAKAPENRQASCLEFAAELRAACALGTGQGRPGRAKPAEFAVAAGQALPATEQAPAVSPQERTPQERTPQGRTPQAAGVTPPVGGGTPGGEATITEAVRPVSRGPTAAGSARGRAPGVTTPDPYSGGYGPPGQPDQPRGGGPGYQAPAPYQGAPRRRRRRALPFLLGFVIVAALAGAGLVALHLGGIGNPHAGPTTPVTVTATAGASSPTSGPSSPTPAVTGPRGVVTAFYNAIDSHHYGAAYRLDSQVQSSQSFATFKQGYSGTQHDALTITGVSGDVVSFNLTADQTDGSVKYYSGTYTVRGGKIVQSNVRQTG